MEKGIVVMDKQGRIYLPKHIKEGFGRKFHAVKMKDEIILIPVPKDPVKGLEDEFRKAKIDKLPIRKLRKIIGDAAAGEVSKYRN